MEMRYSVVIRFVNEFDELLAAEIVDSSTKGGATRKANSLLKETFFVKVPESELDNYRYWRCQGLRKPFNDEVIKVTFKSIKTTKMTFKRSDGIEWGQTARHGWHINKRDIGLITDEEAQENG